LRSAAKISNAACIRFQANSGIPASRQVGQAAIAVGHGVHRLQRIGETQAGRYLRVTVGPV
jgi:hypothetical protein